jgi:hypothetical protein
MKKIIIPILIVLAIIFVVMGKKDTKTTSPTPTPAVSNSVVLLQDSNGFQYVKEGKQIGEITSYFVLIPSINPENPSYKEEVKKIVEQVKKDKGTDQLIINVFDDEKILLEEYKNSVDFETFDRSLLEQRHIHYIAIYKGVITDTGLSNNSLTFFPGAKGTNFEKYNEVEKY